MSRFHAIFVDDLDSDLMELLHLAVKKHAVDWWREFPNLWIVNSEESAVEWQQRLNILFGNEGSLLVMSLPVDKGERKLGYLLRTKKGSSDWLKRVYQGREDLKDPWSTPPELPAAGPSADDEPPF